MNKKLTPSQCRTLLALAKVDDWLLDEEFRSLGGNWASACSLQDRGLAEIEKFESETGYERTKVRRGTLLHQFANDANCANLTAR